MCGQTTFYIPQFPILKDFQQNDDRVKYFITFVSWKKKLAQRKLVIR